ncbi:hypothetical protein [Dactylosporangium sp. NPDC049140]|uniref:hypothetical protein n=1 Tax=Dactylosporangium sp. NPDC049140 TaxID=3155647 RepID=UPI0033FC6953
MTLVVAVHGIGQRKTPADRLRLLWHDAANVGLAAAERRALAIDGFGVGYYADVITKPYPFLGPDEPIDAEPMDADEADWLASALDDVAAGAPETPTGDLSGLPAAPEWLIRRIAAIDAVFGTGAGRLAARVLREVYAYLHRPDLGKVIRAKVRAAVTPGTRVLFGHSLGSVVAYDMLRRGTITADALVTAGSPLGWASVRKALSDTGRLDAAVVGSWRNVYDPNDAVTAGRGLAGLGADITDEKADNGWQDAHGAVRYLSSAAAGRALGDSLP